MAVANSTARSLPYPAIEHGNYSFPRGNYEVIPRSPGKEGNNVILHHRIQGASLVEELIEKGDATYACLVSVPKTGYRKLHFSDSSEQTIKWDLDVVGEPPMLGPLVLYVGRDQKRSLSNKDDVAPIWQERIIDLTKGLRLARAPYLRPATSIRNLLSVRCNEKIRDGGFTVTHSTNSGFYFILNAAPDIFRLLQNPQKHTNLRHSILVHAVSQCFNILNHVYGRSNGDDDSEDHWSRYRNLVHLARWLEAKDIPSWDDENFDAVEAATKIYPINVPISSETDEGE